MVVSQNNLYQVELVILEHHIGMHFPQKAEQTLTFNIYCSVVASVFLYLSFGPLMSCSSLLRACQPCWKPLCLHSHFLSPSLQPSCRTSDFPISGLFHLLNIPELYWSSQPPSAISNHHADILVQLHFQTCAWEGPPEKHIKLFSFPPFQCFSQHLQFHDPLNCSISPRSFKWMLGELDLDYFSGSSTF